MNTNWNTLEPGLAVAEPMIVLNGARIVATLHPTWTDDAGLGFDIGPETEGDAPFSVSDLAALLQAAESVQPPP